MFNHGEYQSVMVTTKLKNKIHTIDSNLFCFPLSQQACNQSSFGLVVFGPSTIPLITSLQLEYCANFKSKKGEDMSTQVAFEMNKKKIKDDCPIPM